MSGAPEATEEPATGSKGPGGAAQADAAAEEAARPEAARGGAPARPAEQVAALRDFVRDVVAWAGGEARAEGALLAVELPAAEHGPAAELAARLGARALRLAFDTASLAPGVDLVVPGGHVLRALDDALAGRGRRAWVEAPATHRLTRRALDGALRPPRGAELALEGRATDAGHDLYVVYRVRYRGRERDDEVEAFRVRLRPGAPPEVGRQPPPEDAFGWPGRPRKRLDDAGLAAALGLADAAARAHAEAEAARREDESRRLAARDLLRLHAYFSGQVAELERSRRTERALARIAELEEERALRLEELSHAVRLTAEVEPLQLLVVEVPLARARVVLRLPGAPGRGEDVGAAAAAPGLEVDDAEAGGEGAAARDGEDAGAAGAGDPAPGDGRPSATVWLDRTTGAARLSACPACDAALGGRVDACAAAHLVHAACLGACDRCAAAVCAACGPVTCAACARAACAACARACPGCGADACADHVRACARCGAVGCAARCVLPCAACGERVCEAERIPAAAGSQAVVCDRCAVACPLCRTATARKDLVRCAACGRRVCPGCHPRDAGACARCA